MVLVEGRVAGATPSTPRVVQAGIYDGRWTDLAAVESAARGELVLLPRARVELGFDFDREEKPRFSQKVEVDPATGLFRALVHGEAHSELTGVTVTGSAPGYTPSSARLGPDPDGQVRKKVLVVVDPVAVPPPEPSTRPTP